MYAYTYNTSSQLLMTGQQPPATTCCDSTPTSGSVTMSPDPQAAQSAAAAAAAVCSLPTAAAAAAYDSRLLSSYPRLATGLHAAAVNGFYGAAAAYPDQTSYVTAALGTNASAFYSSLPSPYDLKDGRGAWGTLPQAAAAACYPYDPMGAYGPYGDRYGAIDNAARRKNATRETTNTLKAWLYEHRKNPYPTKGEKIMLAIITKMTLTQVSTWFANARRRLKKENKMTWEPRNKTNDGADGDDKSDSGDEDNSIHDDRSGHKMNAGSNMKQEEDLSRDSSDYKLHHPHRGGVGRTSSPDNSSSSADCVNPLSTPLASHNLHLQQQNILLRGGLPHGHHVTPPSGLNLSASRNSAFVLASGGGGVHGHLGALAAMRDSPTSDNNRPKIWSLAHTATSDSPPPVRRSPVVHQNPVPAIPSGINRQEYRDPKYIKSEMDGDMYCGRGNLGNQGPGAVGLYRVAGEHEVKPMGHYEDHYAMNGVTSAKNWMNGTMGHVVKNCSAPSSTSPVGTASAFDPANSAGDGQSKDPRLTPGSDSCSGGSGSGSDSNPPLFHRSPRGSEEGNRASQPYCDITSPHGMGASAMAYDLQHESQQHDRHPPPLVRTSPPNSCGYTGNSMTALSVAAKNALDHLRNSADGDNSAQVQ